MRLRTCGAAVLALAVAGAFAPAGAQSEADLKARFEGTTVRVKIDMPAHQSGVDVWPKNSPSIDWTEHGKRLKRYGTSLRTGQTVLVTKVKVKKDLIEFQLGGGGYGTFGDDTGSDVSTGSTAKTQREKNLEQDLKHVTDPAKRRRISEELDALKRDREREDARNRAAVAEAEQMKKELIRSRAEDAGSRFNLRYEPTVPASALEPEGITTGLRQYVEFDVGAEENERAMPGRPGAIVPGTPLAIPEPAIGVGALHKGLSRADVEAALGPPTRVRPGKEGTLSVERATFATDDQIVETVFVEGVLVRYTARSK